MKHIIMADGKELRWKNYLGIHKCQISIGNETLLERTCRLVRNQDPQAQIIITSHNENISIEGAVRYEPKNNHLEIDRFTREIIDTDTVFLYGDCYYTEDAIKTIVSAQTDSILFFGNSERIFAVKIKDSERFIASVDYVRDQFLQGKIKECIGWQVYLALQGCDLDKKFIGKDFIIINDETRDFNNPDDYIGFLKNKKETENPLWDERPIGLFDSGIGGLSCVKAISEEMPEESICYFGDCLRAPYGVRPVEEIKNFSFQIAKFLYSQNIKMLVVACNTVSSLCIEEIEKLLPDIPVLGMVNMTGKYIAEMYSDKRVGIIASPATVKSKSYPLKIVQCGFDGELFTLGCPEFVEAVEAGICSGIEAEKLVKKILDSFIRENRIQILVLGCTHFPFLQDTIQRLYPELIILDPARIIAAGVKNMIEKKELLPASGEEKKQDIYTSKFTTAFKQAVQNINLNCQNIKKKSF